MLACKNEVNGVEEFCIANVSMLDQIFDLILARIQWMDDTGILQWNVTDYTQAYPKLYYKALIEEKQLYVLQKDHQVIGAAALFHQDKFWNTKEPSYYIHHLVSDPKYKGAGAQLLTFLEQKANMDQKQFVRLDCATGNDDLNRYYQIKGYEIVGRCEDGPYQGYLRQKQMN